MDDLNAECDLDEAIEQLKADGNWKAAAIGQANQLQTLHLKLLRQQNQINEIKSLLAVIKYNLKFLPEAFGRVEHIIYNNL